MAEEKVEEKAEETVGTAETVEKSGSKDNQVLRFVCIAVGVSASLLGMRFILGQTGALSGAVAGAGGVVLGTILFGWISKMRAGESADG